MTLANAQETLVVRGMEDANHNVIAALRDGSFYSKDNAFVGMFKIENGQYALYNSHRDRLGYIVNESEVQDAAHKTVGYIKIDRESKIMTVENNLHNVVGRIKPGGIIENTNNVVVGYSKKIEPVLSATFFFLLKMN